MKFTNKLRSQVFTLAHFIRTQFETFSQALKRAWKVIKLKLSLRTQSIVSFSFKKANGTVREAKGTLLPDLIAKHVKGGSNRKKNPLQVKYYDLDKGAFRSFNILRLI